MCASARGVWKHERGRITVHFHLLLCDQTAKNPLNPCGWPCWRENRHRLWNAAIQLAAGRAAGGEDATPRNGGPARVRWGSRGPRSRAASQRRPEATTQKGSARWRVCVRGAAVNNTRVSARRRVHSASGSFTTRMVTSSLLNEAASGPVLSIKCRLRQGANAFSESTARIERGGRRPKNAGQN